MENPRITVEVLTNVDELWTLENEFRNAVGEEMMPESARHYLSAAIQQEKIIFFAARRDKGLIGICSVSPCFSTYACRLSGVFDDFFVRPAYRKSGAARLLVQAAQTWCIEHGYASMMVGCAPEDMAMYQALGFDVELGAMLCRNF